MKTKKCPYCSEEILLEAKKCKHCNEWIKEEYSNDSYEIKKNISTQDYQLLIYLCYIAMFFALVSVGHGMGIHGLDDVNTNIGSGKTRVFNWLIGVITIIPEWFATLSETLLWVLLLVGIRKLYISLNNTLRIPLKSLIVFEVIGGFFALIIVFLDENTDNDFYIFFLVILFLFTIPYLIIFIIAGIRLRKIKSYLNFSSVGLSFILYPILYFILSLMSGSYEEEFVFSFILNGLLFGVALYPLIKIRDLFIEVSESLNEDLSSNTASNLSNEIVANPTDNPELRVVFKGKYFIFDGKTKLYINGVFHSKQSIKKGFDIKVPINNSNMDISLKHPKSTEIPLVLDVNYSYILEIFYH